jgi:hypothetical protein
VRLALALTITGVLLGPAPSVAQPQDRVVVLAPPGRTREGLPVLTRHPAPESTRQVLSRGFSGKLLRLYALEQEFLRRRSGTEPEPAYLLLSDRQGGFPEFGFWLDDVRKPDAGWIDLHHSSTLTGRFGAVDQIFPHELLHVIVHQLSGPLQKGGANQVHAIGVRTDAFVAFSEGFAEHAQIMAVDDADAAPDTKALAGDPSPTSMAASNLDAYGRDLLSRWPFASGRMRFPVWYSQTEQVLRYHAVRANAFAHEPKVPVSLLERADLFPAYLFRSVIPAADADPLAPPRARQATEGVIANLFWRIATDPELGAISRDEAAIVHRIAEDAIGAFDRDVPELWLANSNLMTGTTLFDQFRSQPRVHTFDANAATTFDWLSVPGVTVEGARALVAGAPYERLDAIAPIAGPDVWPRVLAMSIAMHDLRTRGTDEEESLSLWRILSPYLWRLLALALMAAAAGAIVVRRRGVRRWWTGLLVAGGATVLAIAAGWLVVGPWWLPLAAPAVIGGLPWGIWRAARRRTATPLLGSPAVWASAALPAFVLMNLSRWI